MIYIETLQNIWNIAVVETNTILNQAKAVQQQQLQYNENAEFNRFLEICRKSGLSLSKSSISSKILNKVLGHLNCFADNSQMHEIQNLLKFVMKSKEGNFNYKQLYYILSNYHREISIDSQFQFARKMVSKYKLNKAILDEMFLANSG
ncbi:hypothetical protein GJ496_001746 [Pomphorhynchus laevis]|nr:hypothetical protein GJ496_001746 [Pomphorhynchus laevis]